MADSGKLTDDQLQDWQLRQARTFSKWVNMYLAKKGYETQAAQGAEFGYSWQDGVLLMKLMNALYDVKMPRKYKKDAKTRVHQLDNVNQALKMVTAAEVPTTHLKAVNLLDGDFNMMCGMTWNVILDYNIKGISVEDSTAKQGLLIWCRKKTKGYQGVNGNINNFSKDWSDGNAFLALVDRHTTGLVDYNGQFGDEREAKLDSAFTALEGLGIPRLLEVEDMTVERPDEKSVMTYVSELFKLFSKEDMKENAAQHVAHFLNFQRRIDALAADYESRFREFEEWAEGRCNYFGQSDAPEDQTGCAAASTEYKEFLLNEKPQRMADVVDLQDLYANLQGELKVNGRPAYVPSERCDPARLPALINDLNMAEAEYSDMVRQTRMNFLSKMDGGTEISEERKEEFARSFDAFDADKSGFLDKIEFKAALSAVGIALTDDADVDRVFGELSGTDSKVDRDSYMNYLTSFFETSDDAESIMKSLQVLGDPENATRDMLLQPPLTEEDVDYLMNACGDGSLAAYVQASFQE